MDQICCIMVVDGFTPRIYAQNGQNYKTTFLVRELSYAKIDPSSQETSKPKSFRFDLRDQIDSESIRKNGKTLSHQSKMIGLSVHPAPKEAGLRPYKDLPDIVRDMHQECKRDGATLVAHKGGNNESSLLESLGVPYVDLQLYGCPKYNDLVRLKNGTGPKWDCGYHRTQFGGPVPCPMAKVEAYHGWCFNILMSEDGVCKKSEIRNSSHSLESD